jgi:hypothetical protein
MEETQLRDVAGGRDRDPKWEESGSDSDIEWGDEDGSGEREAIDNDGERKWKGEDEHGMAEGIAGLDLNGDVMRNVVRSMGADGQIAGRKMMRWEDEEDEEGGRSDEEDQSDEEVMNAAVYAKLLIAKGVVTIPGDEDDDSDDEDDDEEDKDKDEEDEEWQSPMSGLQSWLERLRNGARGKRLRDTRHPLEGDDDNDDNDDPFERNLSWAGEDEDFIAHIQVMSLLS